MVKFLSTELGVKVKAFEALSSTHPWLSLNHGKLEGAVFDIVIGFGLD
jgi:hypothetical protein